MGEMMTITTVSSRTFNQDTGGAKIAAGRGPVIITDRKRPAYVFMTYAEYERLKSQNRSSVERLAMPDGSHVEFEIPKVGLGLRDIEPS